MASSDSEDSSPEVLTLSSTKKASRTRAEAVHAFEAAQKAKRKRENRERDAALKEAKERARDMREEGGIAIKKRQERKRAKEGKGKEKAKEALTAEERMERAMREAAEEHGSESGSEPDSGQENNDEDAWTGIAGDMDVEDTAPSNHLPEHFFSAAASRPPPVNSNPDPILKPEKKKRKPSKAKELVIGSRTLRTVSSSQNDTLTASLTLPPARVNRFLKRTLNLRQGKGAGKTWERRPVNVGVMRAASGPAPRFARGGNT